jgi:hypothetical protein
MEKENGLGSNLRIENGSAESDRKREKRKGGSWSGAEEVMAKRNSGTKKRKENGSK